MRTIQDCNVCVVGGAGFLGSHLVNHLVEDRGCKVLVVDNLCVGRLEFVHPKADFVYHDIAASEEFLRRVFKANGVRFVFNYAAWPYIPDSFERPLQVFAVNATGALHVINAAQEAGCEGILQVSSAEIYGRGYGTEDTPSSARLDESAPVIPHSSYGAAKAAIDAMVQVRWREAKTPCIALRQFNCVGERETHPYVVPEIISQLSRQVPTEFQGKTVYNPSFSVQAVVKLGNNSFRDFLYGGDAVRIAVELLEHGQFGEVYNLGLENGIKIYDLADMLGKIMGFTEVQVGRDEARVRPWEIWHLQSDNSKLAAALGFERFSPGDGDGGMSTAFAITPLEEALRRTIEWFGANGRKWPWE